MRAFLILIAAGVAIAGVLIWSGPFPPSFALDEDLTTSELRAKLERDIRRDAQASYLAFKERFKDESFDTTHGAAHLFGETLFDVAGVGSILVCDADMNFGCFHGFVRAAVSALGLDAVKTLDGACATLGSHGAAICQHGVGHGILEYVGHDHLTTALEVCASLDQPDPFAGCSGGVFMEYNVPLLTDEGGEFFVAARPLTDPSNPYMPCDTLTSAPFAQSCYHELAQWWKQVYPEDYAEFGRFCEAVQDADNKNACMRGIAKIIPQAAEYDVETSRALCALLPGEEAYGDCIVQAAWAIHSNEQDYERAHALCIYAPEEKKHECPT